MKRLTVILPAEEVDALMQRLMRLRAVSLEKSEHEGGDGIPLCELDVGDEVAAAAARAARVDAVLPVLTKRSTRKKSLLRSVNPISYEEYRRSPAFVKAEKTVAETERIVAAMSAAREEIAAEQALMDSLVPYLSFDFRLDDEGTETSRFLLGALPAGVKLPRLEELAERVGFVTEVLSEEPSGLYVAVICHRKDADRVRSELGAIGFTPAAFARTDGKAMAIYDAAERRVQQLRQSVTRMDSQLDILSENLSDVEILSDIEHTALLTAQNKQRLRATERCAVLTGWCPARCEQRVTALLSEYVAAYSFEEPAEDEEPPILLKNNGFARNFEWVLGMYSYPAYGKFDPTFIMSIFYFLIFGLMFADAGYGLLLVLAGFGAVRLFEPRESMKRFLLMFGYCGISCILFGVLFGSYFGNFPIAFLQNVCGVPVDRLPNLALFPSLEANVAVLFDPLQNPMGFLLVSLGVGAVHLVAGMIVKGVLLCREGKPLDALFDIGSYLVLFSGIACLFLARVAGIVLTAVGVAAILATQGRSKKGIAGRIIGGFGGLYALINYASDLLSYSRILALGLAAGVIAQVVNILATMKGASFMGFIMLILVFCVGHLLNLVINVLGTFVHTSRLQYIEFFGKFYEDGGVPFKPITPADRYAQDVSEEALQAARRNGTESAPDGAGERVRVTETA